MTKVGIFDSGVGGLSIYHAVSRQLPRVSLSYCSDNDFHPYGTKPDAVVAARTTAVCAEFVRQAHLDILVIACNTASTVALSAVRKHLKIPVVGVIPAIKPAALKTSSGIIGLLATPATVGRPYVDELIEKFASNMKVIRVGSSGLVALAEAKARGKLIDIDAVRREISGLFVTTEDPAEGAGRLDAVVLGCTHFPLLIDEFKSAASWEVNWMDSSEAIATRVAHLVDEASETSNGPVKGQNQTECKSGAGVAWMTRVDETTPDLQSMFAEFGITVFEPLRVT